MESAKKLLIGINARYPECRNNQKLTVPIKKLDYAIKTTLKKVQEILERIDTNKGRQEALGGEAAGKGAHESVPRTNAATETAEPRKRNYSNILPLARRLHYIDPNFDHLESHPVGTPTTPTTIPQIPGMESAGQAGPRVKGTGERDYLFLFTKARFGGTGGLPFGGNGSDNAGGNGNKSNSD